MATSTRTPPLIKPPTPAPNHAADDAFLDLRQELEHAHRLATLGTLTAGIAHEINNILTPVLAYAQLAASNPGDAALQSKAAAKALAGVQTATQITQAMLGFSSNPDEPQRSCIKDVLTAALDTIGRNPDKDRISLRIDVPDNLSVAIRPLALQQVLINLILNAWNALKTTNRAKGGTIAISAIQKSDGSTLLRVIDDGPGIPADVVGRLFQPFASTRKRSLHAETTESEHGADATSSGTGLGLTICRRLIENAGGTITAVSNPGDGSGGAKGTTFSITLPTAAKQRAKAS